MSNKSAVFVAAVIFLVAACAALYRLMVGFPIVVAGLQIGQTASFFAFVICGALSFICFKAAFVRA